MKEMPSMAFFSARFSPRIWLRIFSDTASPEASSPARVMRRPEDSFSMFLSRTQLLSFCCRWANRALML